MSVVNFPAPVPQIWVCSCGCSTFSLRADGEAECAACENIIDAGSGGWFPAIKEGPERDPAADPPVNDVQGNGSVDFARQRIQQVSQGDDVAALLVVRACGTIHAWGSFETAEQREWIMRKLDQAKGLFPDFEGEE